jgi:hypothetical protein
MSIKPQADVLKQHQAIALFKAGFEVSEKATMSKGDLYYCMETSYPKHARDYMEDLTMPKPAWLTEELLNRKTIGKSDKSCFSGKDLWRKYQEGKRTINNVLSPAWVKLKVIGMLPSGKQHKDLIELVCINPRVISYVI